MVGKAMMAACVAMGLAGAAVAEPLSGRDAERQLFSLRGVSIELIKDPDLTEQEMGFVAEVAKQQVYYAAVAYSPGDGLVANGTVAAVDYHSVEAASRDALAACAARQENKRRPCAIVARIRPANYEPRALQLSHAATNAVRRSYRGGRGEKAFAASPSTRGWAIAKGDGAAATAVATCNAQAATNGAGDCAVVIAD